MKFKKEDKKSFEKEDFSDKWGIYKYLTEPQSDIKENITSDFILAKLDNKQAPTPEPVIELVRDAYFAEKYMNKLTESYRYKVGKDGKYIRNQDGTFKKFPLDNDEIDYIRKYARMTFNAYMIKLIMTVLMYRNIDKNVLMELITERDRMSEENERLRQENMSVKDRVKENIKKGEE